MQGIPEVTLDTTLGDLYARDAGDEKVALVLCAANSEISPSAYLARNVKYLYQDSTFSSTPEGISGDKEEEVRRDVSIKYLSLVPQHDAFAAGCMPVILFDLDGFGERTTRSKEEAEETISILKAGQKPRLLFEPSPKHINLKENEIDKLVAKMELDELEGLPMAVDLETHYFLNSKAALCESGLPTPECVLLELEGFSAEPKSCCTVCEASPGKLSIPSACKGVRGHWLRDQIQRTLCRISAEPLPFILKNQQTFGGGGTSVVSTPEELSETLHHLSTRILPKLFSQVNESNAHLRPGTLILSELVSNPVGDWGLTFFITRAGYCHFIAITQQVTNSTQAWIGSTILYTAQDRLKHKFTPIMDQIGSWLHKHGYYGPCGADILELAQDSDEPPILKIVDLNVRTSGSLVLGLMKGHFSDRRGLHEATSFSINVQTTRHEFMSQFEPQIKTGYIVIVSWYQDVDSGNSYGNVLVGARDKQELEEQTAAIKELAAEIHF